ncbi:unnamed protein product, partial [Sphacelaria rigidula]
MPSPSPREAKNDAVGGGDAVRFSPSAPTPSGMADSPSGLPLNGSPGSTVAFLYTVPSPTPTPPRTSLRLSPAGTGPVVDDVPSTELDGLPGSRAGMRGFIGRGRLDFAPAAAGADITGDAGQSAAGEDATIAERRPPAPTEAQKPESPPATSRYQEQIVVQQD